MLQKAFIFLLFSTIGITSQAQVYGAKNQVEIEYLNGLQRVNWYRFNSSTPDMGNTIDYSSSLGINYLRKISEHLQIHAGLSYGIESFRIRVRSYQPTNNKEVFNSMNWTSNFQFKLGIKYIEKINDHSNFAIHLGYGQHAQWKKDSKHVITLSNQDVQTIERMSNSYYTGFLYVIPEYQLQLKNKDMISLKAGIQLFNNSYKQGIYYTGATKPWYNPSLIHEFSAMRGNLQFGLGYTFSRLNKTEKTSALKNDNIDHSQIIKNYRTEKSTHSDTAGFLGIQIGIGMDRLQMRGNNSLIQNQPLVSFAFRINYERNLSKNWFLEAGYHFLEYHNSFKLEQNQIKHTSSSNLYNSHQLSFGGGYRLKYNNTPIVNIHGGFTLGLIPGQVYLDPYTTNNDVLVENKMESRVFASSYIGVSKDLHLNNRMILTLNYRWNQGFNTISNHNYIIQDQGIPEPIENTGRHNGTESTILIGLKVKIHK